VVECEGHSVDARKILAIEQMLFARHASALPVEVGSQRANDWIENRDGLHLKAAAALLQQLAESVIDHSEQHDPGVGFDSGDHPVDLVARSHHTPDVLDRLGVIKLHKTGPSHRVDGFARGIRNKVKMKASHRDPTRIIPRQLWVI